MADAEYLKNTVGPVLQQMIVKTCLAMPSDPIQHLANLLHLEAANIDKRNLRQAELDEEAAAVAEKARSEREAEEARLAAIEAEKVAAAAAAAAEREAAREGEAAAREADAKAAAGGYAAMSSMYPSFISSYANNISPGVEEAVEGTENTTFENGTTAPVEPEHDPNAKVREVLRAYFVEQDKDGSGALDKAELASAIAGCQHLEGALQAAGIDTASAFAFGEIDTNVDGKISCDELEAQIFAGAPPCSAQACCDNSCEKLKAFFESCPDKDGDGALDKAELTAAIKGNEALRGAMIAAGIDTEYGILEQLDTNKDGRITSDELCAALFPPASAPAPAADEAATPAPDDAATDEAEAPAAGETAAAEEPAAEEAAAAEEPAAAAELAAEEPAPAAE